VQHTNKVHKLHKLRTSHRIYFTKLSNILLPFAELRHYTIYPLYVCQIGTTTYKVTFGCRAFSSSFGFAFYNLAFAAVSLCFFQSAFSASCKKSTIWPRSSIPVAFNALSLGNGETHCMYYMYIPINSPNYRICRLWAKVHKTMVER